MNIDPFHLVSTPIPLLPDLGLRSEVGLSAEDPSGRRHKGVGFAVWLTVYDPEGRQAERSQLGELAHGERRFFALEPRFDKPHLCVVHRIPQPMPAAEDLDFDMYRSVLQLAHKSGSRGSVIYETPPHFNANPSKPGSFLSFSNQIQVGEKLNTYVVLLNYSINAKYSAASKRRLLVYSPDGTLAAHHDRKVPAFTVDVTDCRSLVPGRGQYSFVACSNQSSMIPLIVNVSEDPGGVSVEHTHPPLSYLNMPMALGNKVRSEAIEHYLCVKP